MNPSAPYRTIDAITTFSSTVSSGNRWENWNTNPTDARRYRSSSTLENFDSSRPSNSTDVRRASAGAGRSGSAGARSTATAIGAGARQEEPYKKCRTQEGEGLCAHGRQHTGCSR